LCIPQRRSTTIP
jgi:hypothetical protein